MSAIIWVHEDCLDPNAPAFVRHPSTPAVFIFDDLIIRHRGYGLKRIGCIYECLLQLPVIIIRGDTVREVQAFMHEHRADEIVTMFSPCPMLKRIADQFAKSNPLRKLHADAFAHPRGKLDLSRFSRYWQIAQLSAMTPTGEHADAHDQSATARVVTLSQGRAKSTKSANTDKRRNTRADFIREQREIGSRRSSKKPPPSRA